ncbi:hypothetical protein [Streptomyces sp. 8N706]|uniref:hypothetical protein n=1 Tax=Streptomyces sp. 8N706 TaxID=3457416 RepID=UPI003FCF6C9A
MTWLEIAGAGGASVPLVLLLLYAGRRVAAAMERCLESHQARLAEREQRASIVAAAGVLPSGGAVVQFEAGQPDWLVWKPSTVHSFPVLPVDDREVA